MKIGNVEIPTWVKYVVQNFDGSVDGYLRKPTMDGSDWDVDKSGDMATGYKYELNCVRLCNQPIEGMEYLDDLEPYVVAWTLSESSELVGFNLVGNDKLIPGANFANIGPVIPPTALSSFCVEMAARQSDRESNNVTKLNDQINSLDARSFRNITKFIEELGKQRGV